MRQARGFGKILGGSLCALHDSLFHSLLDGNDLCSLIAGIIRSRRSAISWNTLATWGFIIPTPRQPVMLTVPLFRRTGHEATSGFPVRPGMICLPNIALRCVNAFQTDSRKRPACQNWRLRKDSYIKIQVGRSRGLVTRSRKRTVGHGW